MRRILLTLTVLMMFFWLIPPSPVHADLATPDQLIALVNAVRIAQGNPPLEVDPILMATAQSTAQIMASTQNCSHIGDVSGRTQSAGYGGGAKVWATENISCGMKSAEDAVYTDWTDPDHMLPMTGASYRNIGAGVADVNGYAYYVIHAAYTSGMPAPARKAAVPAQGTTPGATPQFISPVETVTPQEDGSIIHEVQSGQSLWAIAIAYGVKIADIAAWNGFDPSNPVIRAGEKLVVRGTFTPTLSPTVTSTTRPVTRTPTPTRTPRPPTPTRTVTLTATPTPKPLIPGMPPMDELVNKRVLGYGIIGVCAAGLLLVGFFSLRERK